VFKFESEISGLEGSVVLSNLGRGNQLYAPGDPSDRIFFVRSGRVKVYVAGPGGKNCVFRLVGPGDLFGETALLGEERRRATAEVVERASVTMVPRDAALYYAERHPEFWKSLTPILCDRIHDLEDQLEWVSLLEVEQRIARILLRWAWARGGNDSVVDKTPFRLSQKDLAGLIGATRETTSNALNRLQRKGCVEIRRRRVAVKSIQGLLQYSGLAGAPKLGPEREVSVPEADKDKKVRSRAAQA
jgi:CRP/FNR family transcriptional regulator